MLHIFISLSCRHCFSFYDHILHAWVSIWFLFFNRCKSLGSHGVGTENCQQDKCTWTFLCIYCYTNVARGGSNMCFCSRNLVLAGQTNFQSVFLLNFTGLPFQYFSCVSVKIRKSWHMWQCFFHRFLIKWHWIFFSRNGCNVVYGEVKAGYCLLIE